MRDSIFRYVILLLSCLQQNDSVNEPKVALMQNNVTWMMIPRLKSFMVQPVIRSRSTSKNYVLEQTFCLNLQVDL